MSITSPPYPDRRTQQRTLKEVAADMRQSTEKIKSGWCHQQQEIVTEDKELETVSGSFMRTGDFLDEPPTYSGEGLLYSVGPDSN
jgi:hypothetical protein